MTQTYEKSNLREFLREAEDCGWPKKDHKEVMEVYELQEKLGAQANAIESLIVTANDLNQCLVEGYLRNPSALTDQFLSLLDSFQKFAAGLLSSAADFEAMDYHVVGVDQLRFQVERLSAARGIISSTWPRIDSAEIEAALDDLQHGRCSVYGEDSNEGIRRTGNEAADGGDGPQCRGSRTGE